MKDEKVNVGLIIAYLKYWAWFAVTKVILGIIYVQVISEGLRYLVPGMGQKLYKVPLLHWLRDYEWSYRLDLAACLSLFILMGVLWSWDKAIQIWLGWNDGFDKSGWDQDTHRILVIVIAAVFIIADSLLFYLAMTQVGWGESGLSLSAVLTTAGYVIVLVFVCFVSVGLKKPIVEHRKRKELWNEPPPVINHPRNADSTRWTDPPRMREAPRSSESVPNRPR